MTNIDTLKKAKRLFIDSENYLKLFSDDEIVNNYRLARAILPEITDTSCGEVVLWFLCRALDELPTAQQEIALKESLNLSFKEIDEKHGFSKGYSSKAVKSCLKKLAAAKDRFYIPFMRAKKQEAYPVASLEDFGFRTRTLNTLKRNGITSEQLLEMDDEEISKLRMLGPRSIEEIIKKREEYLSKV